jgi:two-component system response regulator YesN
MLYEPFVSKEWLKGVLTGALDSSYQNSLWLEYCDKRQNVRYVVLGIELSELNRFSEVTISDWRLLRYAVSNIIQEVVPEYATEFDYVELYCSHSVVVLYFNKEKAEHDISATLRKLAERIIFCVQNVLNLGLRIGIGTMKEQWEQLSDSTEEAFHALTNCEYANCQQVDVYEYKASLGGKRLEGPYVRLVKCYQQLSEAIKASQEEHANQIIEAFMRQLEEQGVLTPSFLRRFGMECWTILTYALHEVGIALDDMIPQEHIHTELNSIMRPEQFRGWIADKISIICRNRNFNENTKHKQAVDFIIQYIQKHYHEEITLTELAEKVFISRNYLCDIFKKATGETFHGYLTRVRMEKAKQLVMEGKLHVYEIAQRVGYKNVPYFSTVFKKYFSGISPTEMIK